MSEAGFRAAAWSWADHLRSGGTTSWLEWLGATGADSDDERRGPVPGAAQLELVRRLASRRHNPGTSPGTSPRFAELADLTLGRSGPGRGHAHLPLLWPDGGVPRRAGAPPTDPATVPTDELIRVGIGVLADLLTAGRTPALDVAPQPPTSRRRLGSKAFRLAGAPVTTGLVRSSLATAGRVEGGRRPQVLLFAEPLDVLLAQIWSTRVQRGAPVRWVTFAGRWARRDQLPPAADLASVAAHWAARVGPARVHVVAGADPRRTAAEVLGVATPDPVFPPAPRDLSPAALELLRRLNRVLNMRQGGEARTATLRHVVGLLPDGPASALSVPSGHRAWLDERAGRVADALRAGGYAVHGDLAGIAPRHDGASQPRRNDVLELVLDTCLRAAELET